MALLTVQTVAEAGLLATYVAATAGGGDEIPNDNEDVVLHAKNGSGVSITVTIAAALASASVQGYGTMSKASAGGAVAAGAEKFFGPFPKAAFNNANGRVPVTYSAVTSVTVAAVRVP